MQNLETSRYAFGPFRLDVGERQLSRDGVVQPLRGRPFDLLAVLVARAGELVSKDELLDLAWPGVVVEENNLQVQVSVLRKLLGAEAIATVPGRGYRFQLPVVAGALTRDSARGPVRPRYVDVQGASGGNSGKFSATSTLKGRGATASPFFSQSPRLRTRTSVRCVMSF